MKKLTLLAPILGIAASLSITGASDRSSSSTLDVNGDGLIDEEERQALRSLQASGEQDRKPERKKITTPITRSAMKKAIDQRRSDRFLEADTDGDRILSEEEFRAIPAVTRIAASEAARVFHTLDRDKNRQITLREFTQKLTEIKTKVKSESTRSAKVQAHGAR